jgi:hypothetical protein
VKIVVLLFQGEDEITVILLNSLLLFQVIFLPFEITSSFYYPHANREITIFFMRPHLLLSIPLFLFSALNILIWQIKE